MPFFLVHTAVGFFFQDGKIHRKLRNPYNAHGKIDAPGRHEHTDFPDLFQKGRFLDAIIENDEFIPTNAKHLLFIKDLNQGSRNPGQKVIARLMAIIIIDLLKPRNISKNDAQACFIR